MKQFILGLSLILSVSGFASSCTKVLPWVKLDRETKSDLGQSRLKLVWISLDGLQPEALETWVSKIKNPHPKGLNWLLKSARGRERFKVMNPTITAPSHISTITCAGAGVHSIMDNNMWTGQGNTSGFNRAYTPENWVYRLRRQGYKVGSALYPSIDGASDQRSADVGIFYDNPGSQPQILAVAKGSTVGATIPDRDVPGKSYPIEITASAESRVSIKTPWGSLATLELAKPADITFNMKISSFDRKAGVSFLLLTQEPEITVEVSPIEIMPTMGNDFRADIDRENLIFSGLRDYRFQANIKAYLAALEHRRRGVVKADQMLLSRSDLDAVFLYFEDLDALLHAYYRDDVVEADVAQYVADFDQDIGSLLSMVSASTDLVVLGDHGMSAIAYVINARKVLTEEVASKGTVMAGGGALYFYPPQGEISKDPPAGLSLNNIAENLRGMELDLTGKKLFGKVIVRGSPEADEEGLSGKQVPWIMAFANDGVGFKNSVEDKFLLARAKWASVAETLRSKYPDPVNNGSLVTPVPAGQHGHWNDLSQMRTKLILEGPRVSNIPSNSLEKSLQLVPAVADALGFPRPASCANQ